MLNTWPKSQICMECVYGELIIDEPGTYICAINTKVNSKKCKKLRILEGYSETQGKQNAGKNNLQ